MSNEDDRDIPGLKDILKTNFEENDIQENSSVDPL